MKWKVQITGDVFDLQELERSLIGPDVRVTKDDDVYYLDSQHFDSCKQDYEVREKTSEILAVLNGATKLALGGNSIISVVNIVHINSDGTKHVYLSLSDTINFRDSCSFAITDKDGNIVEETHPADKVPEWVSIGLNDIAVQKAFRLFGVQHHNWVSLYRIFEVIEKDVGGINTISNNGWVSKEKLKVFKHTANSPGAIGDNARHGKESSFPPKNPMLLSEARSLIEMLFHQWIKHK
jgi:hypothetical protein